MLLRVNVSMDWITKLFFYLYIVSNSSTLIASINMVLHEDNITNIIDGRDESFKNYGEISLSKVSRIKYSIGLKGNSYLSYKPKAPISISEGSMELWVYPQWDKHESNTLVSFPWGDIEDGYMVLSNGWWEPEGKDFLYFILSNKDGFGCKSQSKLEPYEWSHVLITWIAGNTAECSIYINGSKVANYKNVLNSRMESKDKIFIGSDRGTTESHARKSNFSIDKFNIYSNKHNDLDVQKLYKSYFETDIISRDHQWTWLYRDKYSNVKKSDGIPENRIIFDESMYWASSKEAADKILNSISEAGFNVYVPCVWHGRGTYYPSKYFKPDDRLHDVINSGDDPLAYLITKAHSLNIEIHPWFTVVRREAGILPEYSTKGLPDNAFNVHDENFRKFIIELMLDVVKRYDIDGINLDYIRSMGTCLSEECKRNYYQEYGRSLLLDKYANKIPKYNIKQVGKWNKKSVTDIVSTFAISAKKIKPKITISVDAHPLNPDLLFQGQDSISWANNNYIDVIFNMDYRQKVDVNTAKSILSELDNKNKLIMLLATYDKVDDKVIKRDGVIINRLIEYFRETGVSNGLAFYHYIQLSDDQLRTLSQNAYSNKVETSWSSK